MKALSGKSIGIARYTASVQQFLNSCPAVERWEYDGDRINFRFDPSVEVPVVPAGVYFDPTEAPDDL